MILSESPGTSLLHAGTERAMGGDRLWETPLWKQKWGEARPPGLSKALSIGTTLDGPTAVLGQWGDAFHPRCVDPGALSVVSAE